MSSLPSGNLVSSVVLYNTFHFHCYVVFLCCTYVFVFRIFKHITVQCFGWILHIHHVKLVFIYILAILWHDNVFDHWRHMEHCTYSHAKKKIERTEYYELSTYKTELDLILDYSLAYLQANTGFCTASNHKTCMVRAKKDPKYYCYSQAQLVYIALQALVLFPGPKPPFFTYSQK